MSGKLVRDKIPQIIEKNEGKRPRTKVLSSKAFKQALRNKLLEEASEAAWASGKALAEELADLEEVIDALCTAHKLKRTSIVKIKNAKRVARGGFTKKIFLIT